MKLYFNFVEKIIKVMTSKPSYNCLHCGKTYIRSSSLDKHRILCDLKHETKYQQKVKEQEQTDIPTYNQLVNLVQELHLKTASLEKQLKNKEFKQTKKDLIDYLNEKYKNDITFMDWVSNINPTLDINSILIMETSEMIKLVFENAISKERQIYYPFIKKDNKNYVYTSEQWTLINCDHIKILTLSVKNKLIEETMKWAKENKDLLRNNDSLSLQFNKFIETLMVFEKKQSYVKSTFIKCIPTEIIIDN